MTMDVGKRVSLKTEALVFKRLGRGNQENNRVCKFWLAGRCAKNPCRFLHPGQAKPTAFKSKYIRKNPGTFKSENSPSIDKAHRNVLKNKMDNGQNQSIPNTKQKSLTSGVTVSQNISITKDNCQNQKVLRYEQKSPTSEPCVNESNSIIKNDRQIQNVLNTEEKLLSSEVNISQSNSIMKKHKLCSHWATGNCTETEKCEHLHSWFCGNGLSMVARLEGPKKAITGIALPSGSNKLYCGSKDRSLGVWDCNSGQCLGVINFDCECVTLVNEGSWIFAGLHNMIKAWDLKTQHEVVIQGSGGWVNAITMFEDILFSGMEDGSILSWKSTSESSFPEVATPLKGHTGSVLSLVVGAKKLFSGSADHTIRVWDAESLQCMHVLKGHLYDVTTVLCWDQYLLSGSLDKSIKVWAATETGTIEEVYNHDVHEGVVAFRGMHDAEGKPILLCSSKDNSVTLFDLPLFEERGRVFSRGDIEAIEIGPEGLFLTGDAQGFVSVWKLN